MTSDLVFDAATHQYWRGGILLPSVTQVMEPLYALFLRGTNNEVMERAKRRGTAVHLACQFDDEGDLDLSTVDEKVLPRLLAWRKFKSEMQVKIVDSEKVVDHKMLHYAGTLDRTAYIGFDFYVLDLKSSDFAEPAHHVQTAAYQSALLGPGIPVGIKRASVILNDDGTYRFNPATRSFSEDFSTFASCLNIYRWKEKHGPRKSDA
jgi:hypothetical protein